MKRFLTIMVCSLLVLTAMNISLAFADEPVTLRYMTRVGNINDRLEESVILQKLEEATNVKLDISQVMTGEYADKQSVTIAGGNLPDIMIIEGTTDMNKYGDQGAFVNLLDYQDKLPNFFRFYEKYNYIMKGLQSPVTGAFYGFTQIYDWPLVSTGWLVRDDIIAKLGIDIDNVKTFEEFEAMLYALKAAYPDVKPLQSQYNLGFSLGLLNDASTSLGVYFDRAAKEYRYGPFTDDLKFVVETYAKWVKDGIFDFNYGISEDEWTRKMTTDKTFVCWTYCSWDHVERAGQEINPEYSLEGMAPVSVGGKPAGGQQRLDVADYHYMVISSATKNLDAALRYMDYVYSDEGINLLTWGVEGYTYEVAADGTKHYTDLIRTSSNLDGQFTVHELSLNNNATPRFGNIYMREPYQAGNVGKLGASAQDKQAAYAYSFADIPVLQYTQDELDMTADILTPADTYVSENVAKFIGGDRPIQEWDEFVEEVRKMNVQTVLDLRNGKLQ